MNVQWAVTTITLGLGALGGLLLYRKRGKLFLGTFCKASLGALLRDVAVEHFAHKKAVKVIAKEKGLSLPVVKAVIEVFAWAKRTEAEIEIASATLHRNGTASRPQGRTAIRGKPKPILNDPEYRRSA